MKSAIFDFDYDSKKSHVEKARPVSLVASDFGLDFAVLRIAGIQPRSFLKLVDRPVQERQALLLIEHPGGRPKEVSVRDCDVQGATVPGLSNENTDFGHRCDTLGGSSGSPIIDIKTGEVVGLHHLGFEGTGTDLVNQGVASGLLLRRLRQVPQLHTTFD